MSTILVVDDSEVDRRLVAGMLAKEESYTIQLANNGEEAVSFLERSFPDLQGRQNDIGRGIVA